MTAKLWAELSASQQMCVRENNWSAETCDQYAYLLNNFKDVYSRRRLNADLRGVEFGELTHDEQVDVVWIDATNEEISDPESWLYTRIGGEWSRCLYRRTPVEILGLQRQWRLDPIWDIENTPGFAAHYAELREWRERYEAENRRRADAAETKAAQQTPVYKLLVAEIDKLHQRIDALERLLCGSADDTVELTEFGEMAVPCGDLEIGVADDGDDPVYATAEAALESCHASH